MNRRLARALIVAAIALGTFLAPGVAAYALWSSTATATLTGVTTAAAPAAPNAPTNLSCSGSGTGARTLSWSAPVAGGTPAGYRVYRSDTGTKVGETGATSISLTEVQVGNDKSNQMYPVVVRSYNITAESTTGNPTYTMSFKTNQSC